VRSSDKTMINWINSSEKINYPEALARMDAHVAAIRAGEEPETIWLLEHPSLYTAGTSAKDGDLLSADLPVYKAGRGGQYTYHGPGQRVAYAMLDLQSRMKTPDIRLYVWQLEEWIIRTLARFGVRGERRDGRVGIWVDMHPYGHPQGFESKIAAIGVRIRRWVSFHGISINLDPDLSLFDGIVPCGLSAQNYGVTSLRQLLGDQAPTMAELDAALEQEFTTVFVKQEAAA